MTTLERGEHHPAAVAQELVERAAGERLEPGEVLPRAWRRRTYSLAIESGAPSIRRTRLTSPTGVPGAMLERLGDIVRRRRSARR